MKTSKVWSLSALSLSAMLAVTACGSGDSNSTTTTGTESKTSTETTQPAKPVTLKMYHFQPDEAAVGRAIKAYEDTHPNVKVDAKMLVPGGSAADNLKKLDVVMSSGEEIDLVMMPSIEEVVKRAATGVLAPLDELYTKQKTNADEEYYLNGKYKGKVYTVGLTSTNWVVVLNKKHLDEAGLPIPTHGWTWDDYREYAKKLSKGEGANRRYGTYFHSFGELANPILYAERPDPYLKDESTPIFDDASTDYFFNLRRVMEKEDKSAKPLSEVVGAKLDYKAEFLNEKASMVLMGSYLLTNVKQIDKFPHNFKTAVAPMPVTKKEQIGLTELGGGFLSLANSSKNKDVAFDFARAFSQTYYKEVGSLPMSKKVDGKAFVDSFIADSKDLFDGDSLKSTLFDPKVKVLSSDYAASYGAELKKVLENGLAKYLLDNSSIEATKKYMMDEAKKVIDVNKGK